MNIELVKVKETLYVTTNQKWAVIYNIDFGQWMLFRPDEADDDAYYLFDNVSEAKDALAVLA